MTINSVTGSDMEVNGFQENVNMRGKLRALIAEIEKTEGTTVVGAVRDLMTDLIHVCLELKLDPEELFLIAMDVAQDEIDLASEDVS